MKHRELYISDYVASRNNNFTILRILLAIAVLYGHAFALHNPSQLQDPLNLIFKSSNYIGGYAVFAFFLVSGFLVSHSFNSGGAKNYVISRLLRIFPALIVCTSITIIAIGIFGTELAFYSFVKHPDTISFLQNSIPFFDVKYFLPQALEGNANPAINGSMWTLIVELRCYVFLFFLGCFGFFVNRSIANLIMLMLVVFGYYHFADLPLLGRGETIKWPILSVYFLTGVFFYVNRSSILLDGRIAIFCALVCYFSFGKNWHSYYFILPFSYCVFYFVYRFKHFDIEARVGDISYGIYIYAFPIQGLLAYNFPTQGPVFNILFSMVIVIPLAYASWHLVEKRALSMKKYLTELKLVRMESKNEIS